MRPPTSDAEPELEQEPMPEPSPPPSASTYSMPQLGAWSEFLSADARKEEAAKECEEPAEPAPKPHKWRIPGSDLAYVLQDLIWDSATGAASAACTVAGRAGETEKAENGKAKSPARKSKVAARRSIDLKCPKVSTSSSDTSVDGSESCLDPCCSTSADECMANLDYDMDASSTLLPPDCDPDCGSVEGMPADESTADEVYDMEMLPPDCKPDCGFWDWPLSRNEKKARVNMMNKFTEYSLRREAQALRLRNIVQLAEANAEKQRMRSIVREVMTTPGRRSSTASSWTSGSSSSTASASRSSAASAPRLSSTSEKSSVVRNLFADDAVRLETVQEVV